MAQAKQTFTPKELAKICGVDPKRLRSWLRQNHPRTMKEKNSSWTISRAVAIEAKKHFAPTKAKAAPSKPKAKATKKAPAEVTS